MHISTKRNNTMSYAAWLLTEEWQQLNPNAAVAKFVPYGKQQVFTMRALNDPSVYGYWWHPYAGFCIPVTLWDHEKVARDYLDLRLCKNPEEVVGKDSSLKFRHGRHEAYVLMYALGFVRVAISKDTRNLYFDGLRHPLFRAFDYLVQKSPPSDRRCHLSLQSIRVSHSYENEFDVIRQEVGYTTKLNDFVAIDRIYSILR